MDLNQNKTNSNPLWSLSNKRLAVLAENTHVDFELPVGDKTDIFIEKIGGSLPPGLSLIGKKIIGDISRVAHDELFSFVLRATSDTGIEDRTFEIAVTKSSSPTWNTPEGLISGASPHNKSYLVFDQDFVDLQLEAEIEGKSFKDLEFYKKSGELPPGLTLSSTGRITGVTESIDAGNFGDALNCEDVDIKSQRNYDFTVVITDGITSVDRNFTLLVVGNDFLTINPACEITIDNKNISVNLHSNRIPVWLTPSDLGGLRANSFATIRTQTIDVSGLPGDVIYTLEPANPDCSPSVLPGEMCLDRTNGYIHGFLPYQRFVKKDHKFTITATRVLENTKHIKDTVVLEKDAFANSNCIHAKSIDSTIAPYLIGRRLIINDKCMTIVSVDDDLLCFDDILPANYPFVLAEDVKAGDSRIVVQRTNNTIKQIYKNNSVKYNEQILHVKSITPVIEYRFQKLAPLGEVYPWTLSEYCDAEYTDFGYVVFDINEYRKAVKNTTDDRALYAVYDFKMPDFNNEIPISERTLDDEIEVLVQQINQACPGAVIERHRINKNDYVIKMTGNRCTRTVGKIRSIAENVNQFYKWSVAVLDDSIDYVELENQAGTHISTGTDLGHALFAGHEFEFDFYVTGDEFEEVLQASKTFNLTTFGEIDSFISWKTDPDLGSIRPWTDSLLSVEATTTVDNSPVLYSVVDGHLPPGMWLSTSGEIIGQAEIDDSTQETEFLFTVEARDRFRFSAKTRQFSLQISAVDDVFYTDVYFRPLLRPDDREYFRSLISSPEIFDPTAIYRPADPAFGIQQSLDMLLFAGIESKDLSEYALIASKNHARKRYILGEFKTAFAKLDALSDVEYEVIYIEVIDPDDNGAHLSIAVKDGTMIYPAKIANMRYRVSQIGKQERNYLPLWMRTAQGGFQELGYQPAIPVCYCKPGTSEKIVRQIKRSGFKANNIDYEVDRYVIKRASDYMSEQYIIFDNNPALNSY